TSIVPQMASASASRDVVRFEGKVSKIVKSCYDKVFSSKVRPNLQNAFAELEKCEAFHTSTRNQVAAFPLAIPAGYSAYQAAVFVIGVVGAYCAAIDCAKNATVIVERLISYGRTLFGFEGEKLKQYEGHVKDEFNKQILEARKQDPEANNRRDAQQKPAQQNDSKQATEAKRKAAERVKAKREAQKEAERKRQQEDKDWKEFQDCLKKKVCENADKRFKLVKEQARTLKGQLENILAQLNQKTRGVGLQEQIANVQKNINELNKLLGERPPSKQIEPTDIESLDAIRSAPLKSTRTIREASEARDAANKFLKQNPRR
ncbi:MAG: hypothetical protein KGO83_07430, partial [Paenibacillaceae bacterium]|nr:hypothetical protein [Paenibacillaceae bacterium]